MKRLLLIAALLLPTPAFASVPAPSTDLNGCIANVFVWEAANHGYTATFGTSRPGTFGETFSARGKRSSTRTVVVSDTLDDDTRVHVMFHELAHVILQHNERGDGGRLPEDAKEVEAEGAAGITLTILGLPPGTYTTAGYLLQYRHSKPRWRTALMVLTGNSMASRVMSYCRPYLPKP